MDSTRVCPHWKDRAWCDRCEYEAVDALIKAAKRADWYLHNGASSPAFEDIRDRLREALKQFEGDA